MKKLLRLGMLRNLRPTFGQVALVAGLIASAALLLFRLDTSPAHLSSDELTSQQSLSLHTILHNPINAPYKIVALSGLHVFRHGVAAARVPSVAFALLAIVLFFIVVLRWHGMRTAWLVTLLFATGSWLLHVGRLGVSDILWLVLPLALLLFTLWFEHTKSHGLALIGAAIVFGVSLFVSAGVWFVLVCVIVAHRALVEHLKTANKKQKTTAGIIFLLFAAAILYTLIQASNLLRPWLGLPQTLPAAKHELKTWAESFTLYPFIRGPHNAELWLGRTPILDTFTSALTLIGAGFYARHLGNRRTQLMLAFVILGSILTALNGAAAMSFLVPIMYLLAATGVTFGLHKWFKVFPRNPLARGAGVILVSLAIAAAVGYHLTEYFVAWPNDPDTKAIFH